MTIILCRVAWCLARQLSLGDGRVLERCQPAGGSWDWIFFLRLSRPCNIMVWVFFRIVSDDSSSDSDCESDGEGSSCSSSSDSEVFDVIAEIKRKKAHPDRLHDELWYNDPGQVGLSSSILHDVAYKGSGPLYATLCNIVLKSTIISCHVTPSHSNQHFSVLHQKN